MTKLISLIREWMKLPPSQKLPTYLLGGAIVAIVGLTYVYKDLQSKNREQREDLIQCQASKAQLEADFRAHLTKEIEKKFNILDSLNSK